LKHNTPIFILICCYKVLISEEDSSPFVSRAATHRFSERLVSLGCKLLHLVVTQQH